MNLRNKATLIGASLITVSALVVASPALAHKSPSKGPGSKSVVASSTLAPTASPTVSPTTGPTVAPTPPAFDQKHKHGKGHHGKHKGPKGAPAPITQTVTVDVPETGTFKLLVSAVKPASAPSTAPERPTHSFIVPVTGTGSQTISLKLPHPGDYTVSLISVVSSQGITATK